MVHRLPDEAGNANSLVSSNVGFESPSTATAKTRLTDSPGVSVSPNSNSEAGFGNSLQSANPLPGISSSTPGVPVQTSVPGAQDSDPVQTAAYSTTGNFNSPQNTGNTAPITAIISLLSGTLTITQLPASPVGTQFASTILSGASSQSVNTPPSSLPASPIALTPAPLILPSTTLQFGDILTTGSRILSYGSNGLLIASQPTSDASPSYYSTVQFSLSSVGLSTLTPNLLINNAQTQPSTLFLTPPSTTLEALQTFIPASEGSGSASSLVPALVLGSQGQILTASGNVVESGQTISVISLTAGQSGNQELGVVVGGSTTGTVEFKGTAISSGQQVSQIISSDVPDGPKTTTTSGGDGLGTSSSTAESSSRTGSGAASQGNRSVVCTMSLFLLAIVGYIVIV